MKYLNSNPIFRFISSIRLAVPLMLLIAITVATGTIYESNYNTRYAQLLIYQTLWFQGLIALLWINIFCSALSRYPYKKHHTGFLITHLGLLTLLIGAAVTSWRGIDGTLRVEEGQSSDLVFLPRLTLTATSSNSGPIKTYTIERSLTPKKGDNLGLASLSSETGIQVDHYLPFVTSQQNLTRSSGSSSSGIALSFTLESKFFNVNETLSTEKLEMTMGPATLRLRVEPIPASQIPMGQVLTSTKQTHGLKPQTSPLLTILDGQSGQELKEITLSDLKKNPPTVNGVLIELVKTYEQALVSSNKLAEGGKKGGNPALEVSLTSGGKKIREVTFTQFPTFSLNAKPPFGLRFAYRSGSTQGNAEEESVSPSTSRSTTPGGNLIEFHVSPTNPSSVRVVLSKGGAEVLSKSVNWNEALETPWMGMKITIRSVNSGNLASQNETSETQDIKPSELKQRSPMPPSALYIRSDLPNSKGEWIVEGNSLSLETSRGSYAIRYGEDSIRLPFQVKLDRFLKVDYPGTETAMSFESIIRIGEKKESRRVQMNEPIDQDGFTLYQSSYEQGPGIPTASIFSVNYDPGRWIKYFGAIILVLGIAVFTLMRSRLQMKTSSNRSSKTIVITGSEMKNVLTPLISLSVFFNFLSATATSAFAAPKSNFSDFTPNLAQQNFTELARGIDSSLVEEMPTQSRGRVKPLDTFARETILFISGKYSWWGLSATQTFLALSASDATPYLQIIEVRGPDLRVQLGFENSQRYVTLQQLEGSSLDSLARTLAMKQQQDEKSLTPDEKKLLEVFQQTQLLKEILTGVQFQQAINLDLASAGFHGENTGAISEKAKSYLGLIHNRDFSAAGMSAVELVSLVKNQPMPELFKAGLNKTSTEVLYNRIRPFFWSGVLYFLIGIILVSGWIHPRIAPLRVLFAAMVPLCIHIFGFATRVYITGFAPVTNMYGTMVWMALGVVLFGSIFLFLYKNIFLYGVLLIGASITLLLAEGIPMVLSPDMDPIVAVLRNNFWLTIHVLTISISYAAFTIAMLLGNTGLVQTLIGKSRPDNLKMLAHLTYRSIQLGIFLLTAGIILGGWWADYSWGRFWGWDPKETWALIADIGFIAILHARYAGWLKPFGVLAAAPIAYLLVIMAWYGVNFILAAGLHSYGFSSGGTTIVVSLVGTQLLLFAATIVSLKFRKHFVHPL